MANHPWPRGAKARAIAMLHAGAGVEAVAAATGRSVDCIKRLRAALSLPRRPAKASRWASYDRAPPAVPGGPIEALRIADALHQRDLLQAGYKCPINRVVPTAKVFFHTPKSQLPTSMMGSAAAMCSSD